MSSQIAMRLLPKLYAGVDFAGFSGGESLWSTLVDPPGFQLASLGGALRYWMHPRLWLLGVVAGAPPQMRSRRLRGQRGSGWSIEQSRLVALLFDSACVDAPCSSTGDGAGHGHIAKPVSNVDRSNLVP